MLSAASALTTVIHDHWSDCERVLIENTQLDNTLRDQLKYLTHTLHDNLVAALSLEQLFVEQNDKTMYIAPFIRSVIHAAVTGVEIQHVSSYPVAVNPCFVNDPLLGLLPRHGYAADIVCANILAPATFEEDDSEGTNSDGSFSDDVDMQDDDYDMESIHEELVKAESDRTTRRWLAGEYITRKPEVLGASTGFYHNQDSSSQDQSVLAYSLLARLTLDASDDSTPLALMCVSKPQDLHVAMASCLYQRSTWGIREPLMGIAFDNRTCFVRVLFAWLENSDDSDSARIPLSRHDLALNLPQSIVHLSHDAEGSYDLSNASDAAVFASYVASMCQRFPVIYEKAKAFTARLEEDIADRRLLVWRVDQRGLAAEIEDGVSWDEEITLWRDSVNSFVPVTFWDDTKEHPSQFLPPTSTMPTTRSSSRNRTAPSEQHSTSSSTETSMTKKTKNPETSKRGRSRSATRSANASDDMKGSSDKDMTSTRGRSQSATRSSNDSNASMEIISKKAKPSSTQGTQIVHTYAEETTDVSHMKNPPPVAGSKSRPATTIFISASVLAAGGRYEDKTILMSYWMVARNVIPRTLMFPLMLPDERYKMNVVFRTINIEYHELVSFSWINKLGALGKNMRSLSLVKLAQATADRMKSKSPSHTGQWMPYKALSASCEKILCDNLWEIASVLEDVQRINANGKTQASELECRHNLDRLMMRFFHGHSNGSTAKISQKEYSNTAHVMVSLERSLMLPTGSLVDAYTMCDDRTDQVDLMVSVNARTDAITIADSRNISKFAKALSPETSNVVPHARNTPDPNFLSVHHSDRTLRTFAEDVEAVQKSAEAALERNNIGRLGVIHVANGKENPMLQPYNEEPLKAVCDSVGYIRIPEVFTSIPASSSFNIIQPCHASPLPSKSIAQQSTPSDLGASKGTSLARRQQMGRDFEMDNLDDLFAISQSFSVSMDPSRRKEPTPLPVEQTSKHSLNISVLTGGESEDTDDTEQITELDVRRDLFLPIISSEHKKVLGAFFATNVNQGRMYATASVKFYVALGIYNLGVYTISSEGSVLVVTVSYAEKPDDEDGVPIVHILERNAISFDISEPLGILNFVTFLIKLRVEYVPKVLNKVYSVIGDSPAKIRMYLKEVKKIPTGGDKNQAAWRKHKPQNV